MYAIIVYDINVDRVNKVKSFLRTHMNWIQNSVFEGEITRSEFEEIKDGLERIMNKEEDSVIIYTMRSERALKRMVMGVEKAPLSGIL